MFGARLSQTAGSTELTPHRPFWAPSLVSILVYQNARRGLTVGSLATRRPPSPFFYAVTLSGSGSRPCLASSESDNLLRLHTAQLHKGIIVTGVSRISLMAPVPASVPALSPFRQINSPS